MNLIWKMCHIMQNSSTSCCCILSRFRTNVQSHGQNVPPTMHCESFFWLMHHWSMQKKTSVKEMEWKLVYNEKKQQLTHCVDSILNYVYFMQTICINSCNECSAINVFGSNNGLNERKISWPFPIKRHENKKKFGVDQISCIRICV